MPSAPQSRTAGGIAALVPLSTIDFLCFEFTRVTELPVSNKAATFVPFNLTWALGLVSVGGLVAKQQDNTVQKLMIAAGRRDEPLFFFLVSLGRLLKSLIEKGSIEKSSVQKGTV